MLEKKENLSEEVKDRIKEAISEWKEYILLLDEKIIKEDLNEKRISLLGELSLASHNKIELQKILFQNFF